MTFKQLSAVAAAILLFCGANPASGSKLPADSLQTVTSAQRYSISLFGMYGWNSIWESHGGFDVNGHMPINRYFELDAALEYHSPSACAVGAVARPKFPLPVGELFLDGAIHGRFLCRYGTCQLTTAASFGYRMDYVSVQVGFSNIFLYDLTGTEGSENENVSEPFNLLYRIAVNCRPATSCWNISLGVANYTEYQYERTWQPIYFLGGRYDCGNKLSFSLRADFKPSGVYHMDAQFWGVCVRAGVTYLF